MYGCKFKLAVFTLAVVSFFVGCGGNGNLVDSGECDCFVIKKFSITPLTKFIETDGQSGLKLVVDALDDTGNRTNAPFDLQCSLYQYLPRTADNKGSLVQAWPQINLNSITENNRHWNDYLRSYEFQLKLDNPPNEQWYLLEIACQIPSGSRIFDKLMLKYVPN